MDPAAVAVAAVAAQMTSETATATTSEKGKGGRRTKKQRVDTPVVEERQPKRSKLSARDKRVMDHATKPFSFPSEGVPLHEDSIFNRAYDHTYLLDHLTVKSDRDLVQEAGPEATFRLAEVASCQLALAVWELEKMWRSGDEKRREVEEKLRNEGGVELKRRYDELAGKLSSAETLAETQRAEILCLKGELEGRDAALKEKDVAFEAERQNLVGEAASYLITGFQRVKYQVSRVHPHADLSMLNVLAYDKNFTWEVPHSGDDEEDEEDRDERGDGEGGGGATPP